jgi:predicted amidohydrolase YtcJ
MGSNSAPEQVSGTAAMMGQLHGLGLTGIVDPGGFNVPPESYEPLFDLWRRGDLTMRMRLFVSAVDAGKEYEQLNDWLRHTHSHFGDDMLRVVGIGEVVHYGCHDFEGLDSNFSISDSARDELLAISRRTAQRGWPMHIHAVLDSTIDVILGCWERVNEEFSLRDLRFSLVHADTISPRNIARLNLLGVGVVVDDHLVFKAALSERAWGAQLIRRAPPLGDLLDAGVPLAAGTDANRASSFSPWLALWWLIAGRSLDGVVRRDEGQQLAREEALGAYTSGSAWLSSEESDRGHLRVGARADFAVLDADYLRIAPDEIPLIRSDLTVVGGREVYSSGALDESMLYRETILTAEVIE